MKQKPPFLLVSAVLVLFVVKFIFTKLLNFAVHLLYFRVSIMEERLLGCTKSNIADTSSVETDNLLAKRSRYKCSCRLPGEVFHLKSNMVAVTDCSPPVCLNCRPKNKF